MKTEDISQYGKNKQGLPEKFASELIAETWGKVNRCRNEWQEVGLRVEGAHSKERKNRQRPWSMMEQRHKYSQPEYYCTSTNRVFLTYENCRTKYVCSKIIHWSLTWLLLLFFQLWLVICWLPWWFRVKESPCQCRRCRFDPWVGKIPWRRKWQPTPVFFLEKFCGQKSLVCFSPWVGHNLLTKQQLAMQLVESLFPT